MMNKLFAFVALALLVALTARAQEIARPVHAVGEWCDYNSSSGGKFRHQIVEVAPDGGFTMSVTPLNGGVSYLRVYNGNHQLVSTSNTKFSPAWPGPDFPIKVGEPKGGGSFKYPHSEKPGVEVTADAKIKSVSHEQIKVPAGTFEAIRVEVVTYYKLSTGYANRWDSIVWYSISPDIKRYLRSDSIDWGRAKATNTVLELVACGTASNKPATAAVGAGN